MDNLVLSNIFYRKTRTGASIAGVALGVVLVVLTTGLVHGFLNEQGRRNSAVTAEIIVGPPGSTFGLNLSPALSMPVSRADQIRAIEGVRTAVPVGQYVRGRLVDGVDWESFEAVSLARIVDGRPVRNGDEVVVDRVEQRNRGLKVGDSLEVFDRPFRVVGVYEPESLGRLKVPLATQQEFLNRPNLCTIILVKLDEQSNPDAVAARILERLPDHSVFLTRNLPILYAQGTPAFRTFLNVVVGLSVIISSLVVLLTMYTTVTERTRQIGILKSLGASRRWIAGEIEKEALLISLLGVVAGFILSVAGKYLMEQLMPIPVELEVSWLLYAFGLGMLSGAFGALYPALRAANQDAVEALNYE
ncbi:MAG TPA: FtsX-like permease family protein [Blastocatellia bacterium]|nr:FtsX-like permease family protein [Blastocatellia bacterium]